MCCNLVTWKEFQREHPVWMNWAVALKLARRTLKQADVTAKAFNDALDAVLTLADNPVAGFSKRRRTILLLLGEKAGMREDVKHFLPRGCVKGPPSFSLIF
jgi:hypothetical protein